MARVGFLSQSYALGGVCEPLVLPTSHPCFETLTRPKRALFSRSLSMCAREWVTMGETTTSVTANLECNHLTKDGCQIALPATNGRGPSKTCHRRPAVHSKTIQNHRATDHQNSGGGNFPVSQSIESMPIEKNTRKSVSVTFASSCPLALFA